MTDFSDIIYLMGAMIIVSMLALNVSGFFRTNEQFQYQNEIQLNAVLVASDTIEELRWIADPEFFNEASDIFIGNDYPKTVTFAAGSSDQYTLNYDVHVSIRDTIIAGSYASNTLIKVEVSNPYLTDNQTVKMEYIKSFAN